MRAARDAGDAAEVNAYTEFRYVAEAHAARFRVTHPASLDAAPPPGAAPSPQIRPWLRPDGTTNEPFVAGLRRRARGAAIRWPGIARRNLAGYRVPALTPAVADEFVRGMVERGELIVETRSAAPETEGAPPPMLRSAAAHAEAEAATREAPTAPSSRRKIAPRGDETEIETSEGETGPAEPRRVKVERTTSEETKRRRNDIHERRGDERFGEKGRGGE